jgi:hypothetical protein
MLLLPVWIENCETFVQCHVFAQSPLGQCPNDISSQHFALLLICVKMFHSQCYLVATVFQIQSLCSQICIYVCVCKHTCSSQYRESGWAKEIKRKLVQHTKLISPRHSGQACLRFASPDLEHGINMFGTRNLNTTKPFNFPICTWIQNVTWTVYV